MSCAKNIEPGVLGAKRLPFRSIPVIDLAALFGPRDQQFDELVETLDRACRDVGFFYVRNHRVPTRLCDGIVTQAERFFALPTEEKLSYNIDDIGTHHGYVPYGSLTITGKPDLQEAYEVCTEHPADDPDYLAGHICYGPNVWPKQPTEFQRIVYGYFEAIIELSHQLCRAFAIALGQHESFFETQTRRTMSQMRLIHYPPQTGPLEEDTIGIGAHTDYEIFTVLLQTAHGGLQVKNTAGDWIEAPPIPDTLIINLGDMLERWTNGMYVSTPHRVINTSGQERYSFPLFFAAEHETIVTPLATCVDEHNPVRYPPVQSGLWTNKMISEVYEYRARARGNIPDPQRSEPMSTRECFSPFRDCRLGRSAEQK
tara:strand:+ start:3087 stop:4196 length:1110 start_codon:yes stop_codon:yes gene_type:complete